MSSICICISGLWPFSRTMVRCKRSRLSDLTSFLSVLVVASSFIQPATAQKTNPTDLQVLRETMYAINSEYDWDTYFPDPCISGSQGIVCEADPETQVYYVTQMQFGFISLMANLIPCSANATIPASIAKLTRLDTLAFFNCFKNATVVIPEEITLLGPSLRLLSFSGNPGLGGTIPAGLGNLKGLQRLVLSQNSLQGDLPSEISTLPMLIQLDLSHNNFSGVIPGSFGEMASLVNWDVRYNRLEGRFPEEIAQGLPSLQRLALGYNKLSGALPDAFTGLQSLAFLDLSHNELSGPVPPSLGSLANLEDLFLNSNGLDGAIPAPLGRLTNLVRLDLSSCSFGSVIPDSLKNLANLRFLSVSNNKLSGSIPASLASLPRIFTLNLDGNQLTGPVPFPPTFVKKIGRNLRLGQNPGLCFTPQLVTIKAPLGLSQCPDLPGMPAKAPTVAASPAAAPNAATARDCVGAFKWGLVATLLGQVLLKVCSV